MNFETINKTMTIESIMLIDNYFSREYLETLSISELYELEDCLLGNEDLVKMM